MSDLILTHSALLPITPMRKSSAYLTYRSPVSYTHLLLCRWFSQPFGRLRDTQQALQGLHSTEEMCIRDRLLYRETGIDEENGILFLIALATCETVSYTHLEYRGIRQGTCFAHNYYNTLSKLKVTQQTDAVL